MSNPIANYYPAICMSPNDSHYFISNMIYRDEESAKEELGVCFVRLATELPPIRLIPQEKPKREVNAPVVKNIRRQVK